MRLLRRRVPDPGERASSGSERRARPAVGGAPRDRGDRPLSLLRAGLHENQGGKGEGACRAAPLRRRGPVQEVIGLSVLRRKAALVVIRRHRAGEEIALQREALRGPEAPLGAVVEGLLEGLPPELRDVPLRLALSGRDLACGDAWEWPTRPGSVTLSRLIPSLLEARSLGESADHLAVDAVAEGAELQGIALLRSTLEDLHARLGRRLELVTVAGAALRRTFSPATIVFGGEEIEFGPKGWRFRPVDGPDQPLVLPRGDESVESAFAAAFAAAVADSAEIPNLVRPSAGLTRLRRYRDVLLNLAAALTLLLGALGYRFHREMFQTEQSVQEVRQMEDELWARLLPWEDPKPGRLLPTMKARLQEIGEGPGGPDVPSALAFGGEVGKVLPDPEPLGLTLDSLDLAADG